MEMKLKMLQKVQFLNLKQKLRVERKYHSFLSEVIKIDQTTA